MDNSKPNNPPAPAGGDKKPSPQRRAGNNNGGNNGRSPQKRSGGAFRGGRRASSIRGSVPPRRGKQQVRHQAASRPANGKQPATIPAPDEKTVRIIPLGGVEEIGRNMTAIEYGNDIIVVDCGLQFSETNTPGIDYILPNTQYLEDRRSKVRGMFITHGHLDHIGGIPYIIDRIGNPTIYTRKLTSMMIKRRNAEFSHLPETKLREVERDEVVRVGDLKVRFFAVTHTIPDSMGVIIETKWGDVVVTGDIKLNHDSGVITEIEEREFGIFKDRNVLALLMDSTNVWQPGHSVPESVALKTLGEIIKNHSGRLIVGTFASQLERLMHIVRIAEEVGKKIVVDGRSMRTNIEIAREIGLLKYKDDTVISVETIDEYPPEKIVILATGAQGDEFASLMRIGNKVHRHIRLQPTDTVVLSSSVVPGNERAVQKLKDNISRQGAHIITYHTSDVHASGHGNREEAVWIHKKIKPKFFIPQHGYHYMLRVHADLIQQSIGIPAENIAIPDNGTIIDIIDGEKLVKDKYKAPAELRVVEGQSVGGLSDVVMRDRKALGEEGFLCVVAIVDRRTGKLYKSPDVLSRGFVYLRDNKELMDQIRLIIRKSVENSFKNPARADIDDARNDVAEQVSRFLSQKTQKNPIVMSVIATV
jgi:ribonuclease J